MEERSYDPEVCQRVIDNGPNPGSEARLPSPHDILGERFSDVATRYHIFLGRRCSFATSLARHILADTGVVWAIVVFFFTFMLSFIAIGGYSAYQLLALSVDEIAGYTLLATALILGGWLTYLYNARIAPGQRWADSLTLEARKEMVTEAHDVLREVKAKIGRLDWITSDIKQSISSRLDEAWTPAMEQVLSDDRQRRRAGLAKLFGHRRSERWDPGESDGRVKFIDGVVELAEIKIENCYRHSYRQAVDQVEQKRLSELIGGERPLKASEGGDAR